LATETRRTKLTYEDVVKFPDDGLRHEIIDGEHSVTAAPFTRHQRIVANLHLALAHHVKDNGAGEVFIAPLDIVFTDTDVVEPDLIFVSKERSHVVTERHLRGDPDLVIEVLSEATRKRDETIKRKLYERCDVSEYWTVDPDLETVRVFRREGGAYGRPVELSRERGDAIETPLLSGLVIALAVIFP